MWKEDYLRLVSFFTVLGMMRLINGQVQDMNNNGQRFPGAAGRRTIGLNPELHRAYVNAYADENQQGPTTNNPWEQLAPRLPLPNEVDCFVEVVRLQRRGGRCTRLGGNRFLQPYICQSGPYFDFYPQCQAIMSNRHTPQQTPSPDE